MNDFYSPQPIPTPCIKVCEMDATTKQCIGCYRTIEEISYWATMGSHAREQVMQLIEVRRRGAKTR